MPEAFFNIRGAENGSLMHGGKGRAKDLLPRNIRQQVKLGGAEKEIAKHPLLHGRGGGGGDLLGGKRRGEASWKG